MEISLNFIGASVLFLNVFTYSQIPFFVLLSSSPIVPNPSPDADLGVNSTRSTHPLLVSHRVNAESTGESKKITLNSPYKPFVERDRRLLVIGDDRFRKRDSIEFMVQLGVSP